MSVLIKGMKKPKACGLCRLCLDDSRIANGYCMIFHRAVNMSEVDKNCPLVEVPEPHGRLIDADKLMAENERFYIPRFAISESPTVIEAEEQEHE